MNLAEASAKSYTDASNLDEGSSPIHKSQSPLGSHSLSGIMDLSTSHHDRHDISDNESSAVSYPSLLKVGNVGFSNGSFSAGTGKLACRYCGKTFSQAGYIKAHERLHTGEKPFVCSVCGKRFSDPSNWKKHERVHSNQAQRVPGDMPHKIPRSLLEALEDGTSLLHHLENGDIHARPPHISDCMLINSDPHFPGHHCHSHPGPVFHHSRQLPPFSSILPYRSPAFPLNFFNSQTLPLSQSTNFTSTPLYHPPPTMTLPSLKLIDNHLSPHFINCDNLSAMSTKYSQSFYTPTTFSGAECHKEPLTSASDKSDADNSAHLPTSELSDADSHSPMESVDIGNIDETFIKSGIERQNLRTRMMVVGSSRKQRHPTRRVSSTGSEHEVISSSSAAVASSTLSSTTKDSKETEDQNLLTYLLNKGRVYKCEHCRIIFDDCTIYLLHNGFHSNDSQPFRCGICRMTCNDRIEFNCHLTSHMNCCAQNVALSASDAL